MVVSEAFAEATVTGLPRAEPPSKNCTVPAAAAGETVAVSFTLVPERTEPVGLTAIAVVVDPATGATTTYDTADDVDPT